MERRSGRNTARDVLLLNESKYQGVPYVLIMSAQRVATTRGVLVGAIVLTFHLTCRKFERGCAMACQSALRHVFT